MKAEDLDIGARELPFQFVGGAPCEAVVGAHGIAVGNDEDPGHV
jgi:hypothetical protein